jgi:hypothetical protein
MGRPELVIPVVSTVELATSPVRVRRKDWPVFFVTGKTGVLEKLTGVYPPASPDPDPQD